MIKAKVFIDNLDLAIINSRVEGNIDIREKNLAQKILDNSYIEYINQKALDIYSIPNKEIIIDKHFSALWGGNMEEAKARIKLFIEHGYKWKRVQTIITKEQQVRYIESQLISEIEDNILKNVWITLKDITEVVLETNEIFKREERYRFFIETNQSNVFRYEFKKPYPLNLPFEEAVEFVLNNVYLAECNKSYSMNYEIEDPTELKGWSLYQTFPEPEGNARKMAEEYVKKIHWSDFETSYNLPNGKKYFITTIKSKIVKDHAVAVWGTRTDITKRKLADMALKEVAWHQSHNVRKPVANILGLATLIEQDPERYEEYLQLLLNSTKKLDQIIKEIVRLTYEYEKEFGEIDRQQPKS